MATPVSNSVPLLTAVNNNNGTLTDEFISGLAQGSAWQFAGPRVITYSLNLNDDGFGGRGPGGDWTPQLVSVAAQAAAAWSNVANISFQQVSSGTYYFQSTADIAVTLTGNDFQSLGFVALGVFPSPDFVNAFFFFPGSGVTRADYPKPEGDLFFDDYFPGYQHLAPGGWGFEAILHEIGHALGLKHPDDDGANGRPTFAALGVGAFDTATWTMMHNDPLATPGPSGFAATPMPLDILAIQHIYGANMSYRTGNDTYVLATDGIVKTIWDAGGTDTIDASSLGLGITLDLNAGTIISHGAASVTAIAYNVTIENAIGTDFADTILGNAAANVLDGRGGLDTMRGDAGNDTYLVDATGEAVDELPGEGIDTVIAEASFSLPANVENLTLAGNEGFSGIGNSLDNVIVGNGAANRLEGGAGNDTLDGGGGTDTMIGGVGDDIYVVADVLPGAPTTGLLIYGDPGAYVYSGPPITRTPDNGVFDILNLGDGPDADTLVDSLFVRHLKMDDGAVSGFFTLSISTTTIGQNFAAGFFGNATRSGDATHPALDLGFDGRGSNQSTGSFTIHSIDVDYSGPSPQLASISFSFELHSEGNTPATYGTFNWNAPAGAPKPEAVIENPGEGTDTVRSWISYALGANLENLTLLGSEHLIGEGNAENNVITGNTGHNLLRGGAGNDMLDGGAGSDTGVYAGSSWQYALLSYQSSVRVADRVGGRDGVDALQSVEGLLFEGDGALKDLSAARVFTPLEYIASYPDLINGFGPNADLGYSHFVNAGRFEGRDAGFKGLEYLATYLDLANGFGLNVDLAASHYIASGRFEGRTVDFNGLEYIASYADLMNGFGTNSNLGTTHYIASGRFEGRQSTFDALAYIASYEDLIRGFGVNKDAGAGHYIASGRFEGRAPSFDALEYIATYGDLIVGFGANGELGVVHYIGSGFYEGRREDFDPAQYLANYPDLQAGFGDNLELATLHFINSGYYEGRTDDVL